MLAKEYFLSSNDLLVRALLLLSSTQGSDRESEGGRERESEKELERERKEERVSESEEKASPESPVRVREGVYRFLYVWMSVSLDDLVTEDVTALMTPLIALLDATEPVTKTGAPAKVNGCDNESVTPREPEFMSGCVPNSKEGSKPFLVSLPKSNAIGDPPSSLGSSAPVFFSPLSLSLHRPSSPTPSPPLARSAVRDDDSQKNQPIGSQMRDIRPWSALGRGVTPKAFRIPSPVKRAHSSRSVTPCNEESYFPRLMEKVASYLKRKTKISLNLPTDPMADVPFYSTGNSIGIIRSAAESFFSGSESVNTIASHFFIWATQMQRRISDLDLLLYPIAYKNGVPTESPISTFTTFLNDVSRWVEVSILSEWEVVDRVTRVEFFISLLASLVSLRNYSVCLGVVMGLSSPHIER